MANTLKLGIKLNSEVFKEIDLLKNKFKTAFSEIKKELKLSVDSGKDSKGLGTRLGLTGGGVTKELQSIRKTIKSTASEIDRSVDNIIVRVDAVFDNVFVGFDNIFSLTRRLRLNIGTFLGNSKATLTSILNQVVKLLRISLPGLIQAANTTNVIAQKATKLGKEKGLKDLQGFLQSSRLPLTTQITVFFDKSQQFFTRVIKELRTLTDILRFAFQVGEKEFSIIEKRANRAANNFNKGLDNTTKKVINLSKRIQSSFVGRIFRGIGSGLKFIGTSFKNVFGELGNRTLNIFGKGKDSPEIRDRKEINKLIEIQSKRVMRLRNDIGDVISSIKRTRDTIEDTILVSNKGIAKTNKLLSGFLEKLNMARRVGSSVQSSLSQVSSGRKDNNIADKTKELKTFEGESKRLLKALLTEFSKLDSVPKSALGSFRALFNGIDNGIKDTDKRFEKFLDSLITGFTTKSKEFNPEIVKILNELSVLFKNFRKDANLAPLGKEVAKSLEDGLKGIDRNSIAGKVIFVISKGLRDGKKDVSKEINIIIDSISKTFKTNSNKFVSSGVEVDKQFAKGIDKASKDPQKSVLKMVDSAMDPLPRSPARIGPLRFLGKSGSQVPAQFAAGILSNIGIVLDASSKIANAVIKPINFVVTRVKNLGKNISSTISNTIDQANKFGDISSATGIQVKELTAIDSAFREVGQRATDNLALFVRISQSLEDIEKQKALKEVGVDIDKIRGSSTPILETFRELSKNINNFKSGSVETRKALESLGLTAQDRIVSVFRRGNEEFERIIETGQNFSSAVNPALVNVSSSLRSIFSNLSFIKESLRNDFIQGFLPQLRDFFQEVLDFFNNNSASVRGFFIGIGKFLGNAIVLAKEFFILLINEPKTALKVAGDVFVALVTLVESLSGKVLDRIRKNITDKIRITSQAAFVGLQDSLGNLATLFFEQFDLRLARLLLSVENFFLNADKFLVSFGNKFLSRTVNVGKRWILIAGAVVLEFFNSIGIEASNTFDQLKIFLLQFKVQVFQTVDEILNDSRLSSLGSFLGFELDKTISKSIDNTNKSIEEIENRIRGRVSGKSFADRLFDRIKDVNTEFGTLDDLIKDLDSQIDESNKKFFREATENFKKAFDNAAILGENAGKISENLFNDEALKDYKKSLNEAGAEILKAVEGTNLKEATKKLLTDLTDEGVNRIQKARENSTLDFSPDTSGLDTTKQKIEEVGKAFQFSARFAESSKSVFSSVFSLIAKESKAAAVANQTAALFSAIVNTAQAVTEALKLPFPLNFAQATAVSLEGGLQAGIIASQAFNTGGVVEGEKGTDRVLGALTAGEFVIPLDIVQKNGIAFFESIRKGLIGAKDFAGSRFLGGSTSNPSNRLVGGGSVNPVNTNAFGLGRGGDTIVENTIVNVKDPNEARNAFSGASGNKAFLNLVDRNVKIIKRKIERA